jgi:hypothetical protein
MQRKIQAWLLAMAVAVPAWVAPITGVSTKSAFAAPAPRYRVGMRVRAKRNCTVQGYQVKRGVVLNVAAVRTNDKGQVSDVDLAISGMTISAVPTSVMDSLFTRA